MSELEDLLYSADLGSIASELVEELQRLHKRGELAGEEDVRAALRQALLERLGEGPGEIEFQANPTVVLVKASTRQRN